MWTPYNPNPHGKLVGDCTVRAISRLVNKSWHETYLDLCLFGMLMMEQLEDMMEDAEKPAEKEALRRCMEALKRA